MAPPRCGPGAAGQLAANVGILGRRTQSRRQRILPVFCSHNRCVLRLALWVCSRRRGGHIIVRPRRQTSTPGPATGRLQPQSTPDALGIAILLSIACDGPRQLLPSAAGAAEKQLHPASNDPADDVCDDDLTPGDVTGHNPVGRIPSWTTTMATWTYSARQHIPRRMSLAAGCHCTVRTS